MHKTALVNYGYVLIKAINHLNRFRVSFVNVLNTRRPLIAARSAKSASQFSVPFQNMVFISFMASGLYLQRFSANAVTASSHASTASETLVKVPFRVAQVA